MQINLKGNTDDLLLKRGSDIKGLFNTIDSCINILWANLKNLRDNNYLVPGQFYRIIDYVTTTAQADTRSAGHQFDVIVMALEADRLSEVAFAAQHEGDTYFNGSQLEAWELRYCIDNDTDRFAWADNTNGKGVIYQMADEYNNILGYDFKNIQYKVCKVADSHIGRTVFNNKYFWFPNITPPTSTITIPDVTDFIWCYTFSSDPTGINALIDRSLHRESDIIIYNNSFVNRSVNKKVEFPFIVFFGVNIYHNRINYLHRAIAINNFYNNTISTMDNCLVGYDFRYNVGSIIANCSIGNNTCKNLFVEFLHNSLNSNYILNTFEGRVYYNVLPNEVRRCHFGGNVRYITIDKDYFYDNIIENGNEYLTITSTQTTSASAPLRNIKICQGCNNGTSESDRKVISHNTVNDVFLTEYKPANSQIIKV